VGGGGFGYTVSTAVYEGVVGGGLSLSIQAAGAGPGPGSGPGLGRFYAYP